MHTHHLTIPIENKKWDKIKEFKLKEGLTNIVGPYNSGQLTLMNIHISYFCKDNNIFYDYIHIDENPAKLDPNYVLDLIKSRIMECVDIVTDKHDKTMVLAIPLDYYGIDIPFIIRFKRMILSEMLGYSAIEHGVVPYFITSSSMYEMAYGIDCLQVEDLTYNTFDTYEDYRNYMIKDLPDDEVRVGFLKRP